MTRSRELGRVLKYLFGNYSFTDFGTRLDYEAYWEKRANEGDNEARLDSVVESSLFQHRLELICRAIQPGSKVVEVGCGDGSLLAELRKRKHVQPFGVDISFRACKLAEARGIETTCADISRDPLPIPKDTDYIIMVEVLEHLPNPAEVLHGLKGKFREGLLVEVPNSGSLNDRLRMLAGRVPKQWVFHPSEHLNFWTVTDFLFWASQLGFTVVDYHGARDVYYELGPLKLWHWYPRLFSRYVLYQLR